jgi:gluconolactonase
MRIRVPVPSVAVVGFGIWLTAACNKSSTPEAAPTPGASSEGTPAGAAPATPRSELPAFCAGASPGSGLPASAKASLLKDGFVFVEGPVWSEQLNAFLFSEMDFGTSRPNGPPSTIHKLTLPSAFEVFIKDSGSNGLAVDAQGLLACTHDTQTVSRYDLASKARSVYVADYESKHFNSPNDIVVHSAGHAYFTDPDWQIAERKSETGVTGVYWRQPSGKVVLVDGSLAKPNGITLSADETRLYVGSVDGVIGVYPVLADGSVGTRQKFADLPGPDGMGMDCAGNLYATSHDAGKVVVFAPSGDVLSTIEVAPKATNVAFGGPDRKTLLITAGGGVYSLQNPIAGFPY